MVKIFDFEYQLKVLPDKPGVYLMKNSLGEVIYVGKAKILKNRVRQYFQNHSWVWIYSNRYRDGSLNIRVQSNKEV